VLLPAEISPGEPFAVVLSPAFTPQKGIRAAVYNGNNTRITRGGFFDYALDGEAASPGAVVKTALLAVSSLEAPGLLRVKIEDDTTVYAELGLTLHERSFAAETIALNAGNTALRTEPDERKTRETETLTKILWTQGNEVWTTAPFSPPLQPEPFRTSLFGDRRVYQYANGKSDTTVHAGIDYRAATGTAVRACARGRVVLAAPRLVTGNSVVLEHLPGVYSLYYHLDSILVAEGGIVEEGAVIGNSGATGLATGPHLHWEIRVAGENTDPDALTRNALLDGEAIRRALGSGA
jgi:murein DD-endopeptidase MepM/ murein hydrolase activator NlpD